MATSVRIPRYILNASTGPLGPDLAQPTLDVTTKVIYGFTNKANYDTYLKNYVGHGELLPYPLIRGYMQGQIDADIDALKLVAIDCESPTQSTLQAVTMQAIITALELKAESIQVSHALTFDADCHQYHIDACAPNSMLGKHESSLP